MSSAVADLGLGLGESVRIREPLAATLGALGDGDELLYSFADVVKLAGHACPTTASAYVGCREALAALYPGETPVRGEVAVTVYGSPEEGSLGVTAQVFTLLTGAAPSTGFKGLGSRFRRKDLLTYDPTKPDAGAVCIGLRRTDTGKSVLLKLRPARIPFPPDKAARMRELMERVLWEAAAPSETAEFRALWMEKVRLVLEDRESMGQWLQVEEAKNG